MFSRLIDRINQKLQTSRFSDKYFTNYPKLTRIFNKGLPIALVSAVVVGLGIATWQIVSLANNPQARGSIEPVASGDFKLQGVFNPDKDYGEFNIVLSINDRAIESRVGKDIRKDGNPRTYTFSSGVNGANQFAKSLLRPGDHTFRVEAREGKVVGQGRVIGEVDKAKLVVKDARNLAALGEDPKTFYAGKLPLDGAKDPRSAGVSSESPLAALPGLPKNLLASLFPKAQAHTPNRNNIHGNLTVIAPPGIAVSLRPQATTLGNCHGGNSGNTDSNGNITFTACPVSNIGGTDATYTVTIGDTPTGWSLDDGRSKEKRIVHGADNKLHFRYGPSQNPATPPPVNNGSGTPAPTPKPTPAPAEVHNYTPDDGPLIALTKLSASSATVDAFGFQMSNNSGINYLKEVYVKVNGERFSDADRSKFTPYATQAGLELALPNLNDGQERTLEFVAVNGNNKANALKVFVKPGAGPGGGTSGSGSGSSGQPKKEEPKKESTERHHTGSIAVSVYAHSAPGQRLDKVNDSKVGAVYVSTENVGSTGNCSPRAGQTDNARKGADDKSNPNFGQIHFKDCTVALQENDNHAKKYKVTMLLPEAGFKLDQSYADNTGSDIDPDGKRITREITIRKGQETEVSFVIWGSNSNTINPPETKKEPSQKHEKGSIVVSVYSHEKTGKKIDKEKDPRVGNIKVKVTNIGSFVNQCEKTEGRTDNDREHEKNFGSIRFDECPLALDSDNDHAKKYKVAIELPEDFKRIDHGFYAGLEGKVEIKDNFIEREITLQKRNTRDKPEEVRFVILGENSNSISEKEFKTPTPPSNFKARTVQPGIINLEWKASLGTDKYLIERSKDKQNWEDLTDEEITGTSFADSDVDLIETKYFYRIYAFNEGQVSGSVEADATTMPLTLSNLKIKEVGPGVAQVEWETSFANPADVSFAVEISSDQQQWEEVDYKPLTNTYTDTGLKFDTKYFYRVIAFSHDSLHQTNTLSGEVTTSEFKPNVFPKIASEKDQSTSFFAPKVFAAEAENHEDGVVLLASGSEGAQAHIPLGALDFEAQCAFVSVFGSYDIPEGKQINSQAYNLTCKDAAGNNVAEFNEPIALTIPVKSKFNTFSVHDLDDAKELPSKYQKGFWLFGSPGKVFASTTQTGTFGVLTDSAEKAHRSIPPIVFMVAIPVLAAGFILLRRFLRQRANLRSIS